MLRSDHATIIPQVVSNSTLNCGSPVGRNPVFTILEGLAPAEVAFSERRSHLGDQKPGFLGLSPRSQICQSHAPLARRQVGGFPGLM